PDSIAPDDNGKIIVTGSFITIPPTDTFTSGSGVAIRIQDNVTLDSSLLWGAGECVSSSSGHVSCRSSDGRFRGKFQPVRSAPSVYLFSIKLKGLPIQAPFQPPLRVTITDDAYIDRV